MISTLEKEQILPKGTYTQIFNLMSQEQNLKNKEKTQKINVIGIFGNKFQYEISEFFLNSPLYYFIYDIIKNDILSITNYKKININNYLKFINIYFNQLPITQYHILAKEDIINDNSTIIFKLNSFTSSRNFDFETMTAMCPVLLKPITNPYTCEVCKNSFDNTTELSRLRNCPMCRDQNFNKNNERSIINSSNNCYCVLCKNLRLYKKYENYNFVVYDTVNLYWYNYMSKEELIKILYYLVKSLYHQIKTKIYQRCNNRNDYWITIFEEDLYSFTEFEIYEKIRKYTKILSVHQTSENIKNADMIIEIEEGEIIDDGDDNEDDDDDTTYTTDDDVPNNREMNRPINTSQNEVNGPTGITERTTIFRNRLNNVFDMEIDNEYTG